MLSAIQVVVTGTSGKTSRGEVQLQVWDPKERTKRSLKALGFCWGMAIVTVIIPLAHFVLVPGFFLAGPVVAWWLSGQDRMILGGKASCPECGAELPLARAQDRWPLSDLCSACQRTVRVDRME